MQQFEGKDLKTKAREAMKRMRSDSGNDIGRKWLEWLKKQRLTA